MTSALSINGKPYNMLDWGACLSFLKALQPAVLTLCIDQVDQTGRILEAKAALPNTKIIARFIDEIHDGSMHLKPQTNNDKYIVSPVNQLSRIRVLGQNGLSAYLGNEPDTKAPVEDLNRLADHTIECMDLAATRDYDMSLTIANYGIGHPKPVDGFLPLWMHPMLMKLNQHRNRHIYGLHAYLPMDTLEHLNALKRTCLERLKIPMPRIAITEWGYDNSGVPGVDGFKNRRMSNEVFAVVGIEAVTTFKEFLESGALLGFCTFIYGDDNWWAYNVETANKGELSTAWRDTVLLAALAGKLDIRKLPVAVGEKPIAVKNTVNGTEYHIKTAGNIIAAFAASGDLLHSVGMIPDNATIKAGNKVTLNGEGWFQVYYSTLVGSQGWIKSDLISLTQTITSEIPIVPPIPPAPIDPVPPPAPTPEIDRVALYTAMNNLIQALTAVAEIIKPAA